MGPVLAEYLDLYFLITFCGSLNSSLSLMEVVVSYLIDNRDGIVKSSFRLYTAMFIICIAASLSMGIWSGFTIGGMNIFDLLD